MSTLAVFLKQLEQEATTTRKMLSRVPEEKFTWQPHQKSMTLKQLATHVAELPSWVGITLNSSELDFSKNPYRPVEITGTKDLLEYFETNQKDAVEQIRKAKEEQLDDTWVLRNGEEIYSTDSKEDVIRMSINQTVHHRAQLGVYLRLLDIPIPGSYGPSADEMKF